MQWASPDYDDDGWELVDPWSLANASGESLRWPGVGWFRIVVSAPVGPPQRLKLTLWQYGASEVFVDGVLVYGVGIVGLSRAEEQAVFVRPIAGAAGVDVVLGGAEEYLVAVRHSFHAARSLALHRTLEFCDVHLGSAECHPLVGFAAFLEQPPAAMARTDAWNRRLQVDSIITGVYIAVLLFHLALFFFYKKSKASILYAACLACFLVIPALVSVYHPPMLSWDVRWLTSAAAVLRVAQVRILLFGIG
jgi:hypothetical protein